MNDYSKSLEILEVNNSLLDTIMNNIENKPYKRSFLVSFGHSKIHEEMKQALIYYKLKQYKASYNITESLNEFVKKNDTTGDYRAYVMHLHAFNCRALNKKKEAIESYISSAKMFMSYNMLDMVDICLISIKGSMGEYPELNNKILSLNAYKKTKEPIEKNLHLFLLI